MKPDKNGMVTDHYTGEKIRYSEAEKGHLMYYEHRYMKEAAERMNMSQKQFNRMNKCSEVLVAQKKENNRGRGFECQDDSVGFNTSLNHIAQYLKYGKSKQEQAAIDKQESQGFYEEKKFVKDIKDKEQRFREIQRFKIKSKRAYRKRRQERQGRRSHRRQGYRLGASRRTRRNRWSPRRNRWSPRRNRRRPRRNRRRPRKRRFRRRAYRRRTYRRRRQGRPLIRGLKK